ncbi:hypothetical protein [Bartonella bovis]|uniref:Uncharacterized protein n=1 Tax=Bartonella bovis m02 TaxID=1094492 RepID=N6VQ73_9HYPH|nr:hypothetical protein [Bartonella bovis]ENN93217.1 hypothetical protein m02_02210 [Bartonella bovis m02]
MALKIHAKWYLQQAENTFTSLQAPRLHWALRNAINTTAKQVERFAEKKVAQVSSIPPKRVKKGVYINGKATAKFLEADIIGSASPLPLKIFKARETKRGVIYKIFGKREVMPHGFIRGGKFPERVNLKMGGHVFTRTSGDKFPIAKQEGTSIAYVMSKPKVSSSIEHHARERLTKNIQSQIARQEYMVNQKAQHP